MTLHRPFYYLCTMMKTILFCLFAFFCQIHVTGTNRSLWTAVDPAFDRLNDRLEEMVRKDEPPGKGKSVLKEMNRLALQSKDRAMMARTRYWESCIFLKSDDKTAGKLIAEALAVTDSASYEYDFARLRFNQGTILINQGDYLNAYILYKRLEFYFKEAGDYLFAGKCCINIAYLLSGIEESQRALEYLHKADTHLREGGYLVQATKNSLNIANIYFQQQRGKEAVQILEKLLEDPAAQTDSVFLVSVLTALNCGASTPQEHRRYTFAAYRMARQTDNRTCLVYTSANLGAYYTDHRICPDSALFYYKQAYSYSTGNPDAYSIPSILSGLSKSFALSGQMDSAYVYLSRYTSYKDSITGNNKIMEINRREGRMAIEKYESELKQARERAVWNRKITCVILLSILFLATLTCYIFWLLRKKEKMEKLLRETENRELSESLSSKNRELTSNTLIISEKNQTLKALLKEIEKLKAENVLPPVHAIRLRKEINNHLDGKDEWQYFKLHFESVHPDFFLHLKQAYPVLTENDLRLCAYIRIGMTTKEVSQMLSVLPETVNMARYRMRKKLELTQEESLEDFLRRF